MKIIFLLSSLGAGGAERVATTLCNEWASAGNEVTLIATYPGKQESFYAINKAVDVVHLADIVRVNQKSFLGYLSRLSSLRSLLISRKADVVVSFLPNVNVAAILATAFTGIPVIVSERSDPSSRKVSVIWRLACLVTYRFANAVVAQTEAAAESCRRIYRTRRNVFCIPNPLPSGIEGFRKSDSKEAGSRAVLLSLGRLVPSKQIEHAIEAFSGVIHENPSWDFHIYGDGPARPELECLVREIGLKERILFKGPTQQAWAVMERAEAFVLTSRAEGFPNALLEAMAVGIPCVAYDCPSGPKEITRNGEDGILVELNDKSALKKAIGNLLANQATRESLRERSRKNILSTYSLQSIMLKWEQLFRKAGVRP